MAGPGAPSGIERAIFGSGVRSADIGAWLERHLRRAAGSAVAEVLFASGRVSAVYGVRLPDGRRVVVKVHRDPVPLEGLRAARVVQRRLWEAGFPCPEPIDGPRTTDGRIATIEALLPAGHPGDGRDPRIRSALAAGLAQQIALLRPDAVDARLAPPAWARWRGGPWPVPHDPLFDFAREAGRWPWIDAIAARAVATLHELEPDLGPVIVGHADWSCGNTRFDERAALVASFDWDSIARDREAIVVGFAAGSSLQGGVTASPCCPSPPEVDAFLDDFAVARGGPLSSLERRAAWAAADWVLAYNARCEAALLGADADPLPGSTLAVLLGAG